MKLHLHIGAHKTATTHLQNVFSVNMPRYKESIRFLGPDEIRSNIGHPDKSFGRKLMQHFYPDLKSSNIDVVVLSEENISGETKDIYTQKALYSSLGGRLLNLDAFVTQFAEVEVWFGIRSMDGFLPSIYCEALRHFPYKKFDQVYSRIYQQSWLPVIEVITQQYPNSRINIIRLENYKHTLPEIISRIFGNNSKWNYLDDERPRASMNSLACKFIDVMNPFMTRRITSMVVQQLSDVLDYMGVGKKYMPFKSSEIKHLQGLYASDVKKIIRKDNVFVY